jgi:hypothetical protein
LTEDASDRPCRWEIREHAIPLELAPGFSMTSAGRAAAVDSRTPLSVHFVAYAPLTRTTVALVTCLALMAAAALVKVHVFVSFIELPARAASPDAVRAMSDLRPVQVTMTTPSWTKVRATVTVDLLKTDHRLWRQMHFDDWDRMAPELRDIGLAAMFRAHGAVLESGPRRWRAMTATDWDVVPQPIRAMAYLRMIWHWAAAEGVGVEFGLSPARLAQTIAAIVMTESWFEHRAVNQNRWGNRDLGLGQCSDYCRDTIGEMAARGEIGIAPSAADYFNPWVATQVATIWFERELHGAAGDVDLAIRAYHRGLDAALDDRGTVYHTRVVRLREQYVRTQRASESWRFLVHAVSAAARVDAAS